MKQDQLLIDKINGVLSDEFEVDIQPDASRKQISGRYSNWTAWIILTWS